MTFGEAITQFHKLATAEDATGDTLRAMYAALIIEAHHSGDARTAAYFYYPHLQKFLTDDQVRAEGEALLADGKAAFDVIYRKRPASNSPACRPEDQPEAAQEQSCHPATRGAAGAAGRTYLRHPVQNHAMSPYPEQEDYFDRQKKLAEENEKPLFDGPGGVIAALILIFLVLLGLERLLNAVGFTILGQ